MTAAKPTIAEFAHSQERKDLTFAAHAAVNLMEPPAAALYSELRSRLSSGQTWLVNHEQYRDASSQRNMVQAMERLISANEMIVAYVMAGGEPIPTSIYTHYRVLFNQYDFFMSDEERVAV